MNVPLDQMAHQSQGGALDFRLHADHVEHNGHCDRVFREVNHPCSRNDAGGNQVRLGNALMMDPCAATYDQDASVKNIEQSIVRYLSGYEISEVTNEA